MEGVPGGTVQQNMKGAVHLALSLGSFVALDKVLKKSFTATAIRFLSALFGMISIFSLMLALDFSKPEAASAVIDFFALATLFIQRWLSLFYVPSLVVLPMTLKGIPTASAAVKIGAILVGGWVASLAVGRVHCPCRLEDGEDRDDTCRAHGKTCTLLKERALGMDSCDDDFFCLGTIPLTTLPFLLAATVLGYILGSGLPPSVKRVFHSIITCAVSTDLAAFAFGLFSGFGFDSTLVVYSTKEGGNLGAGDMLMGFLTLFFVRVNKGSLLGQSPKI